MAIQHANCTGDVLLQYWLIVLIDVIGEFERRNQIIIEGSTQLKPMLENKGRKPTQMVASAIAQLQWYKQKHCRLVKVEANLWPIHYFKARRRGIVVKRSEVRTLTIRTEGPKLARSVL